MHPLQSPVHCHYQTELDTLLWDSHKNACVYTVSSISLQLNFYIHLFTWSLSSIRTKTAFFFFNMASSSSFFFLAALGLCCCVWAFSSYGEQQFYSFKAWASHCSGFSCSLWAKLPLGMWNLLGPMIKSISPTLAGGLLTTGSPGKFRTVSDLSVCLQRVA